MATSRELISDIREMYNAYSDDSKLMDDHILFMLKSTRNMLVKRQMSSMRSEVPKEALQVICLNFELDKQCFDDIDVVKSTKRVPATLDNTGRSDLKRVHAPGSRFVKNINIVDYAQVPYVSSQRFVGNQLFVTVDHLSYLVAYNSEGRHLLLEKLEVEGVFEDPELAYELSCEYDPNMDFMDTAFPINASLISPMKNIVLQELLIKYKTPVDLQNNAEDDQLASRAQKQ